MISKNEAGPMSLDPLTPRTGSVFPKPAVQGDIKVMISVTNGERAWDYLVEVDGDAVCLSPAAGGNKITFSLASLSRAVNVIQPKHAPVYRNEH